ncbi:MAG: oligopeptide transporter, OPT family [Planctomycetes bacterium]|nr:oligopeptide transporter, OPT family [Planctomycetota bacterium]
MSDTPFKPYVPATQSMAELTVKAVVLGVLMAFVLGAANAYLGMKAGLTVAATFPAAVVAMAVLRLFRGTILEENVARTTASVGEALVAGAIFTIPAFVISGAWTELHYLETSIIMMIGGVLGVLFVIVLRRTLVVEAELPFPESVAAAEIVKAGQGGQTGAAYVFGAMGLAGLWELVKNPNGLQIVADYTERFLAFGHSSVEIVKEKLTYAFSGGILLTTPAASPALLGVGYIVGLRVSAVLFSGAVIGWLLLVPLAQFLNPTLAQDLLVSQAIQDLGTRVILPLLGFELPSPIPAIAPDAAQTDIAFGVWKNQIRPLAVGTMIIAAFYTLFNLRRSLVAGITRALRDFGGTSAAGGTDRTERDLDLKGVLVVIALLAIPMFFLYNHFSHSTVAALSLTLVMLVLGFLFAAVAGYLVGLIGSSNNPISGLTLSTLLIAAVLMVLFGVTGIEGVGAVLVIAGVICCAAGIAGDMMQDLKVGHILGGTPWRMQVGEIIGVIASAAVLAIPLQALDRVYHIGSQALPAPQAGLMALMAQGIVGGEMAWPLVIVGMCFALGLILIRAPSPMLVAVGMYLPFYSTAAIFVGGVLKWILEVQMKKRRATEEEKTRAGNIGVLLSSGFIAGEALMAVVLAFLVIGGSLAGLPEDARILPQIAQSFWLGLPIFVVVFLLLVVLPLTKRKSGGLPSTKIE